MTRRPWTDDEIGFLQDHADWTGQQIADELGRTLRSVKGARHALKAGTLGALEKFPWTEAEDAVIADAGPAATARSIAALLPGRSQMAVQIRRRKLGTEVTQKGGGQGQRRHIGGRPLVAKTCTACGLLLAGSWFRSFKKQGVLAWSSRCRKCISEQVCEAQRRERASKPEVGASRSRQLLEKYQRITREGATRHGEPYVEADYEVLADVTLTDLEKALRLKRTYSAVKNARRAAGLKSKPDGLGDPERDVWVIDNPNLEALAS